MSHDSGRHHHDWQNDPPPGDSPFMRGGPLQQDESTEPIGLPKMSRAPPRRIDHTYRNFSNYPVDNLPKVMKSPRKFPCKLHHILSDPECHHIISWMPHGRAWKIHNKELLISEVVPKFFTQSKFESFTRQLNGWGFKRLHQAGNDFNAYYHECFLRGMPQLAALMKRATPNQGRLLPQVEGEPNFYEIDRHLRIPASGMHPGQGRNASTSNANGNVFAPPPFYSPPPLHPPPFYGDPSDPHAMAAHPMYSGQPSYPPYHPMPFGPPPPDHSTNFSHPFTHWYGAQSCYDNFLSSATDHAWNEDPADHVPSYHPMQYDHLQPAQHPHFYNRLGPQHSYQSQTTPATQDTVAVQTKPPDDDEPKKNL